jgi:hypothetical protein
MKNGLEKNIKNAIENENKNIIEILKDDTNLELKNAVDYLFFNNALEMFNYNQNVEFNHYVLDGEELLKKTDNAPFEKAYKTLDKDKIVIVMTNEDSFYKGKILFLNSNDYTVLLLTNNREDLKLKLDFGHLFVYVTKNPEEYILKSKNINCERLILEI